MVQARLAIWMCLAVVAVLVLADIAGQIALAVSILLAGVVALAGVVRSVRRLRST